MSKIDAIIKTVKDNLADVKDNFLIITDEDVWLDYCRQAVKDGLVAIDTETSGLDNFLDKVAGVCIQSPSQKPAYVPVGHINNITEKLETTQISKEALIKGIQILLDGKTKNIFHNYYFDAVVIYVYTGILLPCFWDTQEASKMLDENGSHSLKDLYSTLCTEGKAGVHKFKELFDGIPINYIPYKIAGIYSAHDAEMTLQLYYFQRPFFTKGEEECEEYELERVSDLYFDTELPCLDVLVDMKIRGIELDIERNRELKETYTKLKDEAYERYIKICDKIKDKIELYNKNNSPIEYPPNYKSPLQMVVVFYKILGGKPFSKKEKDNHCTGKKALKNWVKNGLEDLKEMAQAVIDVKSYDKCISDFIDKLYEDAIRHNGKVHANFNLNGAKTGRLSSNGPKQNWGLKRG
jgi:DNA polymerase-1